MPGMPYNLEQGPYLAMLENLINTDPSRCLESLRDPDRPVTDLLRDPPVPINGGPYPDTGALADHIDRDWFGITADGPEHDATSRYWTYWRGDAEGIVRETVVRALEVALGLDHDEALGAGPPRQRWHVSVLTACGIRWFEGWISWRRVGDAPESGHVTIFLLTPTHGKPAEPTLLRPTRTAAEPGPPYRVNPARTEGNQGLWAVGAVLERRIDPEPAAAQWLPPGSFPHPQLGPTYVGEGGIVVVAPPETQGGVLPDGRSYQEVS
jgi:hypothetical protein